MNNSSGDDRNGGGGGGNGGTSAGTSAACGSSRNNGGNNDGDSSRGFSSTSPPRVVVATRNSRRSPPPSTSQQRRGGPTTARRKPNNSSSRTTGNNSGTNYLAKIFTGVLIMFGTLTIVIHELLLLQDPSQHYGSNYYGLENRSGGSTRKQMRRRVNGQKGVPGEEDRVRMMEERKRREDARIEKRNAIAVAAAAKKRREEEREELRRRPRDDDDDGDDGEGSGDDDKDGSNGGGGNARDDVLASGNGDGFGAAEEEEEGGRKQIQKEKRAARGRRRPEKPRQQPLSPPPPSKQSQQQSQPKFHIAYEGDTSSSYRQLRDEYDTIYPPLTNDNPDLLTRLKMVADNLRSDKHVYQPMVDDSTKFSITDCPEVPPEDYPQEWPLLDILDNWNPDIVDPPSSTTKVYQGLCLFLYPQDYDKALSYQKAEKPFVLRYHPDVLRTVERWNTPTYLDQLLSDQKYRTEHSQSNHFMYYKLPKNKRHRQELLMGGYKPPDVDNVDMSYEEWLDKAMTADVEGDDGAGSIEEEHWYLRMNGCGPGRDKGGNCNTEFLFNELPYFMPTPSFFIVNPFGHRGINCRFGMRGAIAENHFDGSRNMIVLLGGQRRYILNHPNQCENLALYPKEHPSGRHSAVDWSDPHRYLKEYPQFRKATGNEVVLQPGDALYLPTFWLHYIVSLNRNYQCNTRSGIRTEEYGEQIQDCGFDVPPDSEGEM